jgi:hypothetical protein
LNCCPLARESSAKKLVPAKKSLFLAKSSYFLIVMVVGERGGSSEYFVLQGREQCVLKRWACMLFFVEFLETVEESANKRQSSRALVYRCVSVSATPGVCGKRDKEWVGQSRSCVVGGRSEAIGS